MIKIRHEKDCCGCEACVQACPKQCIIFKQDAKGFFYPLVNKEKCVDCGACDRACPIINVENSSLSPQTPIYAAYNRNEEQRQTSSSGGIFQLLAEWIIDNHGVVFGAKFDTNWNVVHCYAESKEQIEDLKRSKYVQSQIGNNFKTVKSFLQQGRLVLFVGTPCQIAGLKCYLRRDYESLLTVDLVCHGVPSPMIWQKYLSEKKEKIALSYKGLKANDVEFTSISFRDKVESWRRYHLSFTYVVKKDGIDVNGSDSIVETSSQYVWENDYMLCFLHDYANRPSCFDCKFRNGKCHSDLTLADFWGIENLTDEETLNGDKGTSLIMVHSSKGEKIIDSLPCYMKRFDFKSSFRGNPAVFHSWPKPISHELFFKECKTHSVRYAFEKAHKVQNAVAPLLKLKNKIERKINRIWRR